MKRAVSILMFVLLLVFLMPTAAFGASDTYSVDKVDFVVDLRSDGSALISEEWTVTVPEGCQDCFFRDIVVIDDNFERISGISDLSVSLDGNICAEETGDVLRYGTFFYTQTEDSYSVNWYIPEAGTHVFSVRYIQTGAVKLYKDRAYFYCRAVNEDSDLICRNMTIKINTPSDCFAENFEIVEAGSLAGEKADGSITFTASNTAGLVKIGVAMPSELFDTSVLTLIVDDDRAEIAIAVIFSVVFVFAAGYGIYFALKYKKILRIRREKMCKKNALDEPIEKVQRAVFNEMSPAQVLNTVIDGVPDESDYFTVTALDLFLRGYISVSSEGFSSSEKSMTDHCTRSLDKNEKRVIRLFGQSGWKELISSPKSFYEEINSFNKNIGYLSPFCGLTSAGKKLIRRCFEIKLSAKRFEYVSPQEISDSFFRNTKYTVGDLVISIINEYCIFRGTDTDDSAAESFKHDLFMFRDIYAEGEKIVLEQKAEEKIKKEKR